MGQWIGTLLKDVFSRKLLSTLAGITGIVTLVIVLGETLGPEVIDRDVVLVAIGSIVSCVLYQVTKQAALDARNSEERNDG